MLLFRAWPPAVATGSGRFDCSRRRRGNGRYLAQTRRSLFVFARLNHPQGPHLLCSSAPPLLLALSRHTFVKMPGRMRLRAALPQMRGDHRPEVVHPAVRLA
jgi:hypothetical protein